MDDGHMSDDALIEYAECVASDDLLRLRDCQGVEAHLCDCPECQDRLEGTLIRLAAIKLRAPFEAQRILDEHGGPAKLFSTIAHAHRTLDCLPNSEELARRPIDAPPSDPLVSVTHMQTRRRALSIARRPRSWRPRLGATVSGATLTAVLTTALVTRAGSYTGSGFDRSPSAEAHAGFNLGVDEATILDAEPSGSIALRPVPDAESVGPLQTVPRAVIPVVPLKSLTRALRECSSSGLIERRSDDSIDLLAAGNLRGVIYSLDLRDQFLVSQCILTFLGLYPDDQIDGKCGDQLRLATQNFQRLHNSTFGPERLKEDGRLGPATENELFRWIEGNVLRVELASVDSQ